ncbi:hypothetical protein [Salinibius halmophilus]|uniref:hypothetical protein n=1 Tax=Salinibius halmophilus TaxID=1853216 RepID=UPI000E660145|nr:hypothetical protein [Salinibius halmophilus]
MLIAFALLAGLMFVVSIALMACPGLKCVNRPGFSTMNPSLALAQLASIAATAVAILMAVVLGPAGSLALFVSLMLVVGWLLTRQLTTLK